MIPSYSVNQNYHQVLRIRICNILAPSRFYFSFVRLYLAWFHELILLKVNAPFFLDLLYAKFRVLFTNTERTALYTIFLKTVPYLNIALHEGSFCTPKRYWNVN